MSDETKGITILGQENIRKPKQIFITFRRKPNVINIDKTKNHLLKQTESCLDIGEL
jgi:hypothetical protein